MEVSCMSSADFRVKEKQTQNETGVKSRRNTFNIGFVCRESGPDPEEGEPQTAHVRLIC